jgi:hypothetical protein
MHAACPLITGRTNLKTTCTPGVGCLAQQPQAAGRQVGGAVRVVRLQRAAGEQRQQILRRQEVCDAV